MMDLPVRVRDPGMGVLSLLGGVHTNQSSIAMTLGGAQNVGCLKMTGKARRPA